MLELAILGLLKEQELHGYELKKRLAETLGLASGVSFGSLYPALGRLERASAVRTVDRAAGPAPAVPQTGSIGGELAVFRARPTGARSGRSRKVYAITARGEELFEELLAAESVAGDDARLFSLRLAFARYLPADARLGMLERRRALLVDRLRRAGPKGRTGRGRLDAYVHSLMEHDRESTEHDLSWIERLIARERDESTEVAPAPPPSSTAAPAPPSSTAAPAPPSSTAVVTAAPAPVPPRPSLSGLRSHDGAIRHDAVVAPDTASLGTLVSQETASSPDAASHTSGLARSDYTSGPPARSDYTSGPPARSDYTSGPPARSDYTSGPPARSDYTSGPPARSDYTSGPPARSDYKETTR